MLALEFAQIVLLAELSGCLTGSGPPAPVGPVDGPPQAPAGGRTLPRAPHFAACCQAGRRREASSGLSFGVNAGLDSSKSLV